MNPILKVMKHALLSLGLVLAMAEPLLSQQVPTPYYQLAEPRLLNPACGGAWETTRIAMQHQQRGAGGQGWGRISDFLSIQGARPHAGPGIGWGGQLSFDREHTQSRFALSPSLSAQVLPSGPLALRFGIYGGLNLLGNHYDGVPIGTIGDPNINNDILASLDAGLGTDFSWNLKAIRGAVGLHLNQLPKDGYLGPRRSLTLLHHVMGYAGCQIDHPTLQWSAGPQLLYRNTFNQDGLHIQRGQMDIAIKAMQTRVRAWGILGYRIHRAGVIAGMGLRIWQNDTLKRKVRPLGIDMTAMFFIPGRLPTQLSYGELGFELYVGKRPQVTPQPYLDHPIWASQANIEQHKARYMEPVSPRGLEVRLDTSKRDIVVIRYLLQDDTRQYLGHQMQWGGDSLIVELGRELEGFDGFADALGEEVIEECLSPDRTRVPDPAMMDSLSALKVVDLMAQLKYDHIAIMGGEGVEYMGEFHSPGNTEPLKIPIVLDDRDVIVEVPATPHYVHSLELAVLKLYALRSRLQAELIEYGNRHGLHVIFKFAGGATTTTPLPDDPNYTLDPRPEMEIWFRKMRITTNYPNQKSFQNTLVNLTFLRRPDQAPKKRRNNTEIKHQEQQLEYPDSLSPPIDKWDGHGPKLRPKDHQR